MTAAFPLPDCIDTDLALRLLAESVRDAPLTLLADTLRMVCVDMGHGDWLDPAPGGATTATGTTHRPATHLVEIHLHGITGTGATPEEAAKNWRLCALNQIDGGK